ncbi:MAG: DUF1588 domain-containing protein [Nannocystaceae bacterium]|nr:DUF1588 domain-containing protein [Nannocystaceae bacterium]
MWGGSSATKALALCGAALAITGCYEGVTLESGTGSGAADTDGASGESAGESEGETGDTPEPPSLTCESVGAQPLRRLSSAQYWQATQSLLPPSLAAQARELDSFPETRIDDNFTTFASANTVSSSESIQIEDNAEAIATLFREDIDTLAPLLIPCLSGDLSAQMVDGCMPDFVESFSLRAFRRPPTEAERALVLDLYAGVRDEDGVEEALTAVLQFFLQAPALLYVTEPGLATEDPDVLALSGHEVATRLSLLFLDGLPDDELVAAASDGSLLTREGVEAQARRLAMSAEVSAAMTTFHHEWLRGFSLEGAQRVHPLWDEDVGAAMHEELRAFGRWFIEETDGTFRTLLATEAFPSDGRLNAIYNAGESAVSPRRGLLTTAAAMASAAHSDSTSLVERGAFIRQHVLCLPVPAFPGDIDIEGTLGDFGDLPTARQRLEPLMLEPSCAGCHVGINPFGFPFEAYDWAGAHRIEENGATIDTAVDIDIGVFAGTFATASELVVELAESELAQDCYATHWFRYTMGRHETDADSCSLDEIRAAFSASEGDVRELLVAIAVSDAFRFRNIGGGE